MESRKRETAGYNLTRRYKLNYLCPERNLHIVQYQTKMLSPPTYILLNNASQGHFIDRRLNRANTKIIQILCPIPCSTPEYRISKSSPCFENMG
jgi:hypothetical protein